MRGNIIGNKNIPTLASARGVWSLREQYLALKNYIWPGATAPDSTPSLNVLTLKSIGLAGATNNTFRDDSPNNFLPTRNGDVTQGTFTPYFPTGYWSAYFDGSGDYLSAPNATANFTNQNFTAECWQYFTTNSIGYQPIMCNTGTGDAQGWIITTETNNCVYCYFSTGAGSWAYSIGTSYVPAVNAWTHFALVRNGTTATLYANGVSIGSATLGTSSIYSPSGAFYAGYYPHYPGGARSLTGYMSNIRLVTGTAVYTAPFTPPTNPLTAVTGTSLLCLQDSRFKDNSTNNATITKAGDVAVTRFSPFAPPRITAVASNFGSVYFDGSGDYLSVTTDTSFNLGTGDFTVEAWVNFNSQAGAIISTYGGWWLQYRSDYSGFCFGVGDTFTLVRTWTWTVNQWVHVAVTRSGTSLRMFINGVQQGATATDSTNFTVGSTLYCGALFSGFNHLNGYISNARVVKGSAVYTSDFTPSTTPLTAISGTSLLTCQSASTVTDASTNALTVTKNGDAKAVEITPFKRVTYPYSGSGFFDGAGDYLTVPSPSGQLGSGDFTVEAWVCPTARVAAYPTVWGNYSTWGAGSLALFAGHSGSSTTKYQVSCNGTFPALQSTSDIIYNAWTHLAVVRTNGVIRLYVNGVSEGGTFATTATLNQANTSWVGVAGDTISSGYFNGYISNLRVVAGAAVYAGNFTPPASPVTAIGGTSLLLNFDNAAIYDSTGNQNLLTSGTGKAASSVSKFSGSLSTDGTAYSFVSTSATATSPFYNFPSGTDFTIEFWVYRNDQGSAILYGGRPYGTQGAYPCIYFEGATLYYYVNSGNQIAGGTIPTGSWYHIALCRASGTTRLFVNGSQVGSVSDTVSYLPGANRPLIGNYDYYSGTNGYALNGYLEDMRVTRTARYTAAFTPPPAPFA